MFGFEPACVFGHVRSAIGRRNTRRRRGDEGLTGVVVAPYHLTEIRLCRISTELFNDTVRASTGSTNQVTQQKRTLYWPGMQSSCRACTGVIMYDLFPHEVGKYIEHDLSDHHWSD